MTLKEYTQNSLGYAVPAILVDLLSFEHNNAIGDHYSESFELILDDKYGLSTLSPEPDFLDQLIPFAQADDSGSFYALWLHQQQDINYAPIVIFGSHGGIHIVSCNLLEFLQLISLDVEPMIDEDGVYYYKDEENYEPSPNLRKYKKWLRDYYHLSPISTNFAAEQLIDRAQECYQEAFLEWIHPFLPKEYSYY